jgi:hypothetical protein
VGRTEREDSWILLTLADDSGGCIPAAGAHPQRVIRLTAGPKDMGVDLGRSEEVGALAPSPHLDGSTGPILVVNRVTSTLDIIDATGSGKMGTQGDGFLPVKVVSDALPLHYAAVTQVSFHDSDSTAGSSMQLALKGRFGNAYLLTTETDAWSLSTTGEVRLLHRYAPIATGTFAGWVSSTWVDLQPSCAMLSRTVTNPSNGHSQPIDPYVLTPSPPSDLRLLRPASAFTPDAHDGLTWLYTGADALPSLVRAHCDTGLSHVIAGNATPLAPVNWFAAAGRQGWWPFLTPLSPDGHAAHTFPSGKQMVLSGAHLAAYEPGSDTLVDYGALPELPGEYILKVWPRQGAQASSDALLFDVMTMDDQGVRRGALLAVRPRTEGSIRLIKSGLPVPFSTVDL